MQNSNSFVYANDCFLHSFVPQLSTVFCDQKFVNSLHNRTLSFWSIWLSGSHFDKTTDYSVCKFIEINSLYFSSVNKKQLKRSNTNEQFPKLDEHFIRTKNCVILPQTCLAFGIFLTAFRRPPGLPFFIRKRVISGYSKQWNKRHKKFFAKVFLSFSLSGECFKRFFERFFAPILFFNLKRAS